MLGPGEVKRTDRSGCIHSRAGRSSNGIPERLSCRAAQVRPRAADATRGPAPAGFVRRDAVVLLRQAPTRRRHPGVAPGAALGHARHRAGGCGVSAVHPTAPIGHLTAPAASAGWCRAGSGPARAAERSSPGPSRPAPVWTEGPTGFPPPGFHRPRLGPAEYGPRRRRRARAPALARSQAHTPGRGHYLGLPRGRAGRHPPAPTALRADQPGSAVRSHDEGWHASSGDWRPKCRRRHRALSEMTPRLAKVV